MKPNWKDAPEWANWLAQDEYGYWFWYEYRPEPQPDGCWVHLDGKAKRALQKNPGWVSTIEERPS
jgi:hypothetical protein